MTIHVLAVPEHAPLQPVKEDPAAGAAVKVTAVPVVNAVEQAVPQEMPAGALVTVPLPAPDLVTVSAKDDCMKVAVTFWAVLIVTVQVLVVPVQPPPQPVKVEPAAGVAVNVTAVPLVNDAEQVAPQEMPAGALVTVPEPAPAVVNESVNDGSANVAVTLWAALITTVQVLAVPEHAPLQPAKVEPAAGAAVKVTAVPLVNAAEQVAPQEMPAGALVTVPEPAPAVVSESVNDGSAKVAVTPWAALIVTVQVLAVPEQAPLQPVKVDPAAGAAVSVTAVPLANVAEQVAPQAMPAGALVTVPEPAPAVVSESVNDGSANVAVTPWAALIVTVQVLVVPEHAPLQPVKEDPAAGAAVSVTAVPLANVAEQVAPQEIPAGALVTVPEPAPAVVSESVNDGSAKVAVTLWAALIVTVQVLAVPEQPPLQPVKEEPAAGAAVKVTTVPIVNAVEQVVPQEMPAGALVTVPLPAPDLVTVSAKDACMKVAVTL